LNSEEKVVAEIMLLLRNAFGSHVPLPDSVKISVIAFFLIMIWYHFTYLKVKKNWLEDSHTLGAYSYPRVNATEGTITRLAAPLGEALYFAGEATAPGAARGTTHGAFLSGVREAQKMLLATRARAVPRREAAYKLADAVLHGDYQKADRDRSAWRWGLGGLVDFVVGDSASQHHDF
jgi:hypothetical protein